MSGGVIHDCSSPALSLTGQAMVVTDNETMICTPATAPGTRENANDHTAGINRYDCPQNKCEV